MDVDRLSFYPLILDILTDISEAHFVSIDLELSGVPSKDSYAGGVGKPTLQQRYLETKQAAERYQILQIGLTCVEQDILGGKYVLKPYNFNLCPVIYEKGLDIERIFSFQSGAAEFLLKTGFDINKVFMRGVPYLSREEVKLARLNYTRRQDKDALPDIQIKPTDTESIAFLERVRGEINSWVSSLKIDTPEYLNIVPLDDVQTKTNRQLQPELTRLEKRLVHQLVRAEYPELVTISRRGFIQIIELDMEREARILEERKREFEERVGRQKGFRWIIEALLGSNITNFDLRECAKDSTTGQPIFIHLDESKAQFYRAQTRLRNNPKVLVGHNCFLDMVYIYRTFIGQLPDTVEEFQRKLHRLWPVVVDTKYMSTHNCGDISPMSSLEQIAKQLSSEETPIIQTAREHAVYDEIEAFHEAGYDSFLTAQVVARLSTKLEREGAYIKVDGRGIQDTTNIVSSLKLTQHALHQHNGSRSPINSRKIAVLSDSSTITPGANATKTAVETPATECLESTGQGLNSGTRTASALDDLERAFQPSVIGGKWKRIGDPTLDPPDPIDPFGYSPGDLRRQYHVPDVSIPDGMPRFGSDFWRVYGNKLRVFGTEEGVCILDPAAQSEAVNGDDEDGGVEL